MSINQDILDRKSEGRLVQLSPRVLSDPNLRSLYLTPELHEEVFRSRADDKEIERYARLQADLEVFITSETLDPKYLYGLSPASEGIWEIRSVRPRPSIRVFGMFAVKDRFIATHSALRNPLGGWKSWDWAVEIRRTKAIWRNLFPSHGPITSTDMNELITGALNERYFRK